MARSSDLYSKIFLTDNNSNQFVPGSKTYKGFSTISVDSESFALYDLALIKQDITNHFHIRKGELLENPGFGTIIWDLLFDPLTDGVKQQIKADVDRVIGHDPRVIVKKSTVTKYEYGLTVECELEYLPYRIVDKMRITFDENNRIMLT